MVEDFRKKKILLVDDDLFFIEFERAFLQREHFDIIEATNGGDALNLIRTQKPDLTLLDLYMPDIDGLEVVVRARAEGFNLPIVLVSKETDPAKIAELKEAGATDFLSKPIEIDELIKKVTVFLEESCRSGSRLPVTIKLRYRALDELLAGESRDISTSGIFVRTKKDLAIGTLVELFLYRADDNDAEPIRVMGEVVRTEKDGDDESGAGLKFINLDPESVKLIADLIEEERKRNKVHVLVVDDDKVIREILKDALVAAGFKVKICDSAVDALRTLNVCHPSLILADIMMPGMSGIEFAETFRKNSRLKDIPFVFVSGKIDKDTVLMAKKSGATFFIAKPFDPKTLAAKVAQIIGAPKDDD